MDGTPQSHVDPDRPELLVYEYVQQIGHAPEDVALVRGKVAVGVGDAPHVLDHPQLH